MYHDDMEEDVKDIQDLSISAQNSPPRGTEWSQAGRAGRRLARAGPAAQADCPGSVVNKNN